MVDDMTTPTPRTTDCRPPTDRELRATTVLALDLHEASAKTRTGWPIDDAEDMALEHWAAILPIREVREPLQPDPITVERRRDQASESRAGRVRPLPL